MPECSLDARNMRPRVGDLQALIIEWRKMVTARNNALMSRQQIIHDDDRGDCEMVRHTNSGMKVTRFICL
jgi:hypothetical protein